MPDSQPIVRRLKRFLIRCTIEFVVLMVVYVLSIGPMFWQWYEAQYLDGSKLIVALYEPLLYATRIPIIKELLNDYINWWIL